MNAKLLRITTILLIVQFIFILTSASAAPHQSIPPTLDDRLESIVVGDLTFSDAPISEVVEVLRKASKAYDPESQGVNIFVKLSATSGEEQSVSFTIADATLRQALDRLASSADLIVDTSQQVAVGLLPNTPEQRKILEDRR